MNFASEDEANKFKKVLEGKLFERHKKRLGMIIKRGFSNLYFEGKIICPYFSAVSLKGNFIQEL